LNYITAPFFLSPSAVDKRSGGLSAVTISWFSCPARIIESSHDQGREGVAANLDIFNDDIPGSLHRRLTTARRLCALVTEEKFFDTAI